MPRNHVCPNMTHKGRSGTVLQEMIFSLSLLIPRSHLSMPSLSQENTKSSLIPTKPEKRKGLKMTNKKKGSRASNYTKERATSRNHVCPAWSIKDGAERSSKKTHYTPSSLLEQEGVSLRTLAGHKSRQQMDLGFIMERWRFWLYPFVIK